MIDPGISVVSDREETLVLCSTIGHTGWVAPLVVSSSRDSEISIRECPHLQNKQCRGQQEKEERERKIAQEILEPRMEFEYSHFNPTSGWQEPNHTILN